jgi:methylmalonyl-CoA mutase
MSTSSLATPFPQATEAHWRAAVEKALKGQPFDRLVAKTSDDITIQPLYEKASPAQPVGMRAAAMPWRIACRIDHPDPRRANPLALADLEGGASQLTLVTPASPFAHGVGVSIETVHDLADLFDGVLLDIIALRLDAGHEARHVLATLIALAERRGLPLSSLEIAVGLDPLGYFAAKGRLLSSFERLEDRVIDAVASVNRLGFTGTLLTADGRAWHAGGATPAQELAALAAQTAAYWRLCERAGLSLEAAADWVDLIVVADQDQFGTIAKLRAARLIVARMRAAAGLPAKPVAIHAETAWRMMTKRDPNVNMLRGTIAAFAAGVGGADSVCLVPHTQANGLPDAMARRVARNAQSILIEESNLHRVADPAGGSGYVETLTQELASRAWACFQALEAEGGLIASLRAGRWQGEIAAAREARVRDIARRKTPLTGTSEFPNVTEPAPKVMKAAETLGASTERPLDLPAPDGGHLFDALIEAARAGRGVTAMAIARGVDAETCLKLPFDRDAAGFEALRDAADAATSANKGQRPVAFVATLGTVADFTARATWIRNVMEAGGFLAPVGEGHADIEALAAAFRQSGARIAILASSDAVYARGAHDAARALKAAGATTLYLAGKPKDDVEAAAYRAAGLDGFIHAGQDMIATLKAAQAAAGFGS